MNARPRSARSVRVLEPDAVIDAEAPDTFRTPSTPLAATLQANVTAAAQDVLPTLGVGLAVLAIGVFAKHIDTSHHERLQEPPPPRARARNHEPRTRRWRNL